MGCCAHVAAVVYYLSNGRYQSKVLQPAAILTSLFSHDNMVPTIPDDSDEDD